MDEMISSKFLNTVSEASSGLSQCGLFHTTVKDTFTPLLTTVHTHK